MVAYLSISSLALLALLVLSVISFLKRRSAYQRLKHIRGPPLAGWTNLWQAHQIFHDRFNNAQRDAIAEYGSPARIGPNLVVTDDPDLIRHMSAARSKWSRSKWYSAMKLDPKTDSVFSTRDEKIHQEMRSMEIGAYNGRDVDTFEQDIDENLHNLFSVLRDKYDGKNCELAKITAWLTLDVLSKIAFGERFGFLDANEDLWNYNKIAGEFWKPLEFMLNMPILRAIFQTQWVADLLRPKPTDAVGQGAAYGWAQKRISARYASATDTKTQPRDMLGYFISKGLNQAQCEAESRIQVIAGSDSTSSILRNTMMFIIANPAYYSRIRAEIDKAVTDHQLADTQIVPYSVAARLDFVQACIWEGMRMFPPLFGLKSKLAPPGGETFKGVFYPEGTEVCQSDLAMTRRVEIFGEDAQSFNPQRFCDVDEELRNLRVRTTDLLFGNGRYSCLGKHIGMVELSKTFAELFRRFEWAVADPINGCKTVAHTVWIQQGMMVSVRPRKQ